MNRSKKDKDLTQASDVTARPAATPDSTSKASLASQPSPLANSTNAGVSQNVRNVSGEMPVVSSLHIPEYIRFRLHGLALAIRKLSLPSRRTRTGMQVVKVISITLL